MRARPSSRPRPRGLRRGALAATVGLLIAMLVTAGCARRNPDDKLTGTILLVFATMPLSGPEAPQGRAVVRGAKMSVAERESIVAGMGINLGAYTTIRGRPGHPDPEAIATAARRVAQDGRAIGYVGDLGSGSTEVSLPITNQGGVPQISPGASATGLTRAAPGTEPGQPARYQPAGRATFVRLVPASDVQARGAAAWAADAGARRPFVLRTAAHSDADVQALAFADQARAESMSPAGTATGEAGVARLRAARPDLVYLPGRAGPRLPRLLDEVERAAPDATIMLADPVLHRPELLRRVGSDSRIRIVGQVLPPQALPARGQAFVKDFRRRYGVQPDDYAAYGYEATDLLFDAVARASDPTDRPSITRALFATHDRNSVIGRYSVTPTGDTTLRSLAGWRVRDGRPVYDHTLTAPPVRRR